MGVSTIKTTMLATALPNEVPDRTHPSARFMPVSLGNLFGPS
jgi:hypothetical protein